MKNITEHTGKIVLLKRLKNSFNGNPRFECAVIEPQEKGLGWTFVTQVDHSHGYEIQNYIDRDVQVTVTIGTYYNKATLHSIKKVSLQ